MKPNARDNKAKDVETPKCIDIPDAAKANIARMNQNLSNYIAGIAAGLDVKDKWNFDMRSMQFVIKEQPSTIDGK